MAHIFANGVQETCSLTGTGNATLTGAVAGFRTFASKCAVSDTVHYRIEAVNGLGVPTGLWEVGRGTYSATNTLARTTVLESSNSNALENFAGSVRVSITVLSPSTSTQVATDWVGVVGATGDFKFALRASVPPGWIQLNGGTIGSASSGATRANLDTQALFTLWWTDYSDAQLPILTSAGAASTRGASAAADWAANKRMSVFDLTDDRFLAAANGTSTVNGTAYADQIQNHNHAINLMSDAAGAANLKYTFSGTVTSTNGTAVGATAFEAQTPQSNAGSGGAIRVGTKTLPPRLGALALVKL